MLKEIIGGVGLILVGVLPWVRGDEGLWAHPSDDSLANLVASIKENCPEHQDPLFCFYWIPNDLADFQSPISLTRESPGAEAPANKPLVKETQGKGSAETVMEFPESRLQKRFLVARRKTLTPRGYKRGPGFRSWGGKRDSPSDRQRVDKRSKFGPWGGKRDGEYLAEDWSSSGFGERNEKRARFQNWGGKRNSNDLAKGLQSSDVSAKRGFIWKDRFYLNEPFKKAVPKRPQFQSWGGKRAPYAWTKLFRFSNPHTPSYSINGGEKRLFSSWGGKRHGINAYDVSNEDLPNWEGDTTLSSVEGTSTLISPSTNDINPITTHHSYWKKPQPLFTYDTCHDNGTQQNNHR